MVVPVKLFQGPMVLVKLFSTFRYHGAVPVKLLGRFLTVKLSSFWDFSVSILLPAKFLGTPKSAKSPTDNVVTPGFRI